MGQKSVFITRTIPDTGITALAEAGMTIRANPHARALRPEELLDEVGQHDGVICQLADKIDAAVLNAATPRCKVFATCAVGYDNFDLKTAGRLGIAVTNTPDVLTNATADLAWSLIMATARRIGEAERFVRAGAWRGWGMLDFLGVDVYGRTIGIVGAGRIGTAVARRATGFSMNVLYFDDEPKKQIEALGARRVDLPELLAASDFVSLHVPLTEATRRLIDRRALYAMRRNAILINTARGDIVDQPALIEALREGRILAAGLDVYQNEPHVPKELLELANVVLLPHIGSATVATRSRMAEMAAENVIAVLNGRPPLNPVIA
jgi:glyoxylate reductase